jgi:hypothetical protein
MDIRDYQALHLDTIVYLSILSIINFKYLLKGLLWSWSYGSWIYSYLLFQLYCGDQFYWWSKPDYQKKATNLSQVTDKHYHINVVHLVLIEIRIHNIDSPPACMWPLPMLAILFRPLAMFPKMAIKLFLLWVYLMTVIPETCIVHYI